MFRILILNHPSTMLALNRFRIQNTTRAKLAFMSAKPPDPVTEYVRWRLLEWRKTNEPPSVFNRRAGFKSKATLNEVEAGRMGVGPRTLPGFALAFGMTVPEFTQAAYDWWAHEGEQRSKAQQPERWVELDERYPSRKRAIRAAREMGYPEEAIADVLRMPLHFNEDPGEDYWFNEFRSARDRMKVGIRPSAELDDDV